MKFATRWTLVLATVGAVAILTPDASAQSAKLGKKYHTDEAHGYKFKYPHEWLIVPVQPRFKDFGMVCQMDGPDIATKIGSLGVSNTNTDLVILQFEERVAAPTTGDGDGGLRNRVEAEKGREDIADVIPRYMGSLRDFEKEAPEVDEEVKVKSLTAHHRTWNAFTGDYDITIDTWTFHLSDRDICLVFDVAEQNSKKWLRVFEKAAKTFAEVDRVEQSELEKGSSYEDLLAFHMEEASQTPGWRAISTPSRKYIIKTSSDNEKFLDEVIERLEKSRELYVRDFPPSTPIEVVSVVRVCGTADEFHSYGKTARGTAGWFNPASTELVLYDAVEYDRNMSYAVMSHEAFHQYCHFLFEQSEAHRWFDEGHGDYYGGLRFRGSKVEITSRMPAGLNRLQTAKELCKNGTFVPLEDHLNYTHQQWQSKGIDSYCQSWSIIYYLRQGMLGDVPRKVWEEEYEQIIPNYMSTLYEGFKSAYTKIREEREAEAKADGRELTEDEKKIDRFALDPDDKKKIWKDAMDASWGQVDLDEFQANWVLYVSKYLK